jgi:hypothetical protein
MPAWAVTEAVMFVCPAATDAGAVTVGACGAATTVTVAFAGALVVDPLLSTQVNDSVPGAPAVKLSVFLEPLVTPAGPLVMVPPEMVQVYVMPERAVTLAVDGAPAVMALLASVIVGVTGCATEEVTATDAVPGALVAFAVFFSVTLSVRLPTDPEVKVTLLTPALVTPATALVMVPLVMDQA